MATPKEAGGDLQHRGHRDPDLQSRWNATEEDTSAAFADELDVLAAAEQAELAALIDRCEAASRPAARH